MILAEKTHRPMHMSAHFQLGLYAAQVVQLNTRNTVPPLLLLTEACWGPPTHFDYSKKGCPYAMLPIQTHTNGPFELCQPR